MKKGFKPITNIHVFGMDEAIRGSKFPMAVNLDELTAEHTSTQDRLASCKAGSGHDQFLTGIVVHFDLTFSIKAWVEIERYHFMDFVSSQSTMHRIERMNIADQCNEFVDPLIVQLCQNLVTRYLHTRDAEDRLRLLYSLPAGLTYTAAMVTNYRQLKTIYSQRVTHRLPEWRRFCAQLACELPRSEWITGDHNDAQM